MRTRTFFALIFAACLGTGSTSPAVDEPADGIDLILGRLLPEEGGVPDAQPGPLRTAESITSLLTQVVCPQSFGCTGRDREVIESAILKEPFGVDFTLDGTMIIVELGGGRVHAFSPEGRFRTISGDGSTGYEGDGGPAVSATFNGIHNVAVTPKGVIYIADSWNHCVRRLDPEDGSISTFAGTGKAGYSGEEGPATNAMFNFIMCATLSAENDRLFLADLNNRRIRVVDLEFGIVSLVAGNGEKGVPEDGEPAREAPLFDPRAVAVDSLGRVYILERGGHALRRVELDGTIRTVAGTGKAGFADGPALQSQLNSPKHLAIGPDNSVYIADDENSAIRHYDPNSETVSTILGRGFGSPSITLLHPHGDCVEGDDLFIVDTGHNRIFRMPRVMK